MPWHRYNLVKTGLKSGYYDICERMLYSNFWLLTQFVEKCNPFGYNLNEESKKEKEFREEVQKLYHWWKIERPNKLRHIEEFWENVADEAGTKVVLEQANELKEIEQQNLERLIEIRQRLCT